MKSFIISFFVFSLLAFLSCKKEGTPFENNSVVLQTFSPEEAQQLKKILGFFDTAICEAENKTGSPSEECYYIFFERMLLAERTGVLDIKIPIEKQDAFFNNFDKELFNKIWHIRKQWAKPPVINGIRQSNSDTFYTYNVYDQSDFVKFIGDMGKENEKANSYFKKVKRVSDISPTMVKDVLNNYNDYNISDERMRLIIAVHYLTLNKEIEENKKAHERLKAKMPSEHK